MVYAEDEGEMSVTMCLSTTRTIPEATMLKGHDFVPFTVPDRAGQEIKFNTQRVKIPLLRHSDKPLITELHEILVKKNLPAREPTLDITL
jgi:hypothetical protein